MSDAVLSDDLSPLAPLLGRWRTSGQVLHEHGAETAVIAGTDTYAVLPGGHWIAHEVDVRIADDHVLVHELIGGAHPDGGWSMHAFDAEPGPGLMRLAEHSPGRLLLEGDQVRSWLDPHAGADHMTTRWERRVDGTWLPWMPMRFDRL